jgi:hypothetical protein
MSEFGTNDASHELIPLYMYALTLPTKILYGLRSNPAERGTGLQSPCAPPKAFLAPCPPRKASVSLGTISVRKGEPCGGSAWRLRRRCRLATCVAIPHLIKWSIGLIVQWIVLINLKERGTLSSPVPRFAGLLRKFISYTHLSRYKQDSGVKN